MYALGDQLPTERTLAADLHVHRRAVRTAIDQLVSARLVTRRPHCRATVGESPQEADKPDSRKPSGSRISTSSLVALIMWHGGGPLEHAGTSQQRIFWGMNQALMKLGYHAVFLDLGLEHPGSEEENAVREAAHLQYVLEQGFGGAVFYPYAYRSNAELVQEVAQSVPTVLLDRKIEGANVDFVGLANRQAMFDVTQHLLSMGHRRIAHVTKTEPIHSVTDRVQGFVDAMRTQNAPDIIETVITIPPYRDHRTWIAADAILRLPVDQRPTAAACFTDYQAVSLAEHLTQLGLSIPSDIALTGFDNIVPAIPSGLGLTTIAQPYEDMGSKAIELLMRRIDNPSAAPVSVELPGQLIVRASSSP